MVTEKVSFGMAVTAGVIVMFLFALVFINMFQFIPFVGPFVGGLVAGLLAGRDFLNGGKAGILAGLIGAAVVSLDFIPTQTCCCNAPVSGGRGGTLPGACHFLFSHPRFPGRIHWWQVAGVNPVPE